MSQTKNHTFYVQGMHCASCELLIEKRILELNEIKSADASAGAGEVLVEYIGENPPIEKLNKIFKKDNYVFSDNPFGAKKETANNNIIAPLFIAAIIIIGFLFLNRSGLSDFVNINSKSSLPAFFLFGLLAGISSCAALVGGLVLSMSKQWLSMYSEKQSTRQKLEPHIMFNAGRLISYAFFGALLGAVGSQLKISISFTSLFIIVISVVMAFLAFQMLGVKKFRKFQITMPKFISRYIANETNFKSKYMPFSLGALTFFLPCGFTISAQGLALISGNPYQGALIMFFFALGTTPVLFLIGLSSVKFSSRPHLAARFAKVAGFLVLFFALFNINNQLNILGYASINDLGLFKNKISQNLNPSINENDLPQIVNGKQVIKMDASPNGYSPNYFKVRAGVPILWEITDKGTSGCTNAIISKNLFNGQIALSPGQISTKEFTPQKPGKYKFSCWMGMVSGTMEVVDTKTVNLNL